VALLNARGLPSGSPLGPYGRICIGLPTVDLTVLQCGWTHASGNDQPKGIDLVSVGYNRRLFEESFAWQSSLAQSSGGEHMDARRAATLALNAQTVL